MTTINRKTTNEDLQREIALNAGLAETKDPTSAASLRIAAAERELANRGEAIVVPNMCHASNKGGKPAGE
jgi:hypothetical protein